MEEIKNSTIEPIAIIGTSCRLPGRANSPSKLWELLKHPVDLLAEIPHTRYNPTAFYHENPEHPGVSSCEIFSNFSYSWLIYHRRPT